MGYLITDYFEASRQLKDGILRIEHLRSSGKERTEQYRIAEEEVQVATEKIDVLLEIFTWETTDTDNIRRAFLTQAAGIEVMLANIHKSGLYPDPYNGTTNKFQLLEEITDSFREALKNTGRYCPRIDIKARQQFWMCDTLPAYVRDMQSHLQYTTFDNLLEALRYFETSSALINLVFKLLEENGELK